MKKLLVAILATSLLSLPAISADGGGKKKKKKARMECRKDNCDPKNCNPKDCDPKCCQYPDCPKTEKCSAETKCESKQ